VTVTAAKGITAAAGSLVPAAASCSSNTHVCVIHTTTASGVTVTAAEGIPVAAGTLVPGPSCSSSACVIAVISSNVDVTALAVGAGGGCCLRL
jgi:hypothetical protein